MKGHKILKRVISTVIITSLLLMSMAIPSSASENDEMFNINETGDNIYDIIIDEFEKTGSYAGAYFDGDVLHISSAEPSEINSVMTRMTKMSRANSMYSPVISSLVVEEARYSYDELSEAMEYIITNVDQYGVTEIYLSPQKTLLL